MKILIILICLILVFDSSFGQSNSFPTTGKVGIGTTSPQYNLDIDAELPFLKIRSSIYSGNPTVLTIKGGIIFNQEHADKTAAILEAVPPGYHVPGILFSTKTAWNMPGPGSTDWYHRMFIHPNGNIGVGTTNPGEKLSVNGKMRAHEVKVETANWPDFVFAKDYKLRTLQETERHIQEKGHLPGIPSAAEVEKNGIELGDMNKKLLQKIEELTLYLIEMKKDAGKQAEQIRSLSDSNKKLLVEIEKIKTKP